MTEQLTLSLSIYTHTHTHIHTHAMLCCAVLSHSVVSDPMTVASQAPLSIGILQESLLEWVAMPSSRASSQPRD